MVEISYAPLGEVVREIIDRRGVTPRKLGGAFSDRGYRVISARSIKGRRVDLDADFERFVEEPVYQRWMRGPLEVGDVLLTSEAPLGEPAYVRERVPWCVGQRLFALRPDESRVDGRYLFYALQAPTVRRDLESRATGTTVLGIRQSELRRVQIPTPKLDVQRRIGALLGALDDKIELNRRMNETLEQLARVTYDDAVSPQQPSHLADLRDLATEHTAKVNPQHVPDELFNHYSLPAFDAGTGPVTEAGSGIKSAKTIVPEGAVLVSRLNPRIPRVWLPDLQGDRRAIASTEFLVLTPKASWARSLLYLTASSKQYQDALVSMAIGTSGSHQRVRPTAAMSVPVVVPAGEHRVALERQTGLMFKRIHASNRENAVLEQLRDTLLPKLISGELRIPDAERFVSEAA
jgi:type I restriction enzyme, S subunit